MRALLDTVQVASDPAVDDAGRPVVTPVQPLKRSIFDRLAPGWDRYFGSREGQACAQAAPGDLVISGRYPLDYDRLRNIPFSQLVIDAQVNGKTLASFANGRYGVATVATSGEPLVVTLASDTPARVAVPALAGGAALLRFRVGYGWTRRQHTGQWKLFTMDRTSGRVLISSGNIEP